MFQKIVQGYHQSIFLDYIIYRFHQEFSVSRCSNRSKENESLEVWKSNFDNHMPNQKNHYLSIQYKPKNKNQILLKNVLNFNKEIDTENQINDFQKFNYRSKSISHPGAHQNKRNEIFRSRPKRMKLSISQLQSIYIKQSQNSVKKEKIEMNK